jgi:hypothetical protein
MRNFVIYTVHQILLSSKVRWVKYVSLVIEMKPSGFRRIILKWTLNVWFGEVYWVYL